MTCEKCKVDLLSLVYGEYEPSEAEAMHGVIASCSSCSTELEKLKRTVRLARQLDELEPPRALDRLILERARAHVAEQKAASRAKPAMEEEEKTGLWAALLRWVGTFAMGPQVAMATLTLLVIGIGLWYLPEGQRRENATGTVVHAPDNEGIPVEPTREEVATLEQPETERAGVQAIQLDEEEKPEPAARQMRNQQRAAGDVIERPLEDLIQPTAPTMETTREATSAEGLAQNTAVTDPMPVPVAQQRAPDTLTARERFDRGVQAQQRGDFSAAIQDFDSVLRVPDDATRELVPNALHRLAASHKRNNNCEAAIPHYEALVERFPRYGGLSTALMELAECYRTSGRLDDANQTLRRAGTYRSTQDRARIEQRRLEEMNRARRAPAPAESVAPQVAH
jgi:TolA-binding protein